MVRNRPITVAARCVKMACSYNSKEVTPGGCGFQREFAVSH